MSLQTAAPATPDDALHSIGAACQLYEQTGHRVATLTLHTDLLVWVQSGSKTIHHARGSYRCDAGHLLMVARNSTWDVANGPTTRPRYQACVLHIEPEMAADFHLRYPALAGGAHAVLAQVLAVDDSLGQSLRAAADALAETSRLSAAVRRHRVTEVLMMLAERGWVFPQNSRLGMADRVRRIVAGRLHADWCAKAVAHALHTSPSTLARHLAKEGTSIAATVREARLEAALDLLQSSELPVGDIAQQCGYGSHSRFSAAFKARFGFAPSVLRETA